MDQIIHRVVLVEDQPKDAQLLKTYLEQQSGFIYIATATGVDDAIDLIPRCLPDLVLMDIEYGNGNAFDILNALTPLSFKVIFVSNFPEYALTAIKFGALDYLLKPLDPLELRTALAKVVQSSNVTREQLRISQSIFIRSAILGG
ncbi:response regulator [Chitinophaga sedimenti]|uniref:LytR/AlgR family response regulator transcription factor n=1 Tax=Chitinophaga sedimenti TaxID=2033606 RepID=UPI002006A4F3|nr:response regulator [Chitinophaga sedimenti]MCK7559386.1 response regulator [Chitinophaga sedimenti]